MSKKLLLLILTLALAGGVFWLKQTQEKQGIPTEEHPTQVSQNLEAQPRFVTEVDPDVSNWQMKATKYFTIRFPKEWYLIESDLKETGYYSVVITNNPDFDIDKYADIGMGVSWDYPLVLSDNSEIVITTNNLGWVTNEVGTPREFMDWQIDSVEKKNPNATCHYTSDQNSVLLTALCRYKDVKDQVVTTYYVSQSQRTYAYTAVVTQGAIINKSIESILEQIAKNVISAKEF